jgi:NAD(P)-dependent dehydrogenase (short-subunit alcohol dehydrogenase family)
MDLELSDKVAVITGAGKGIGLAVTRALADEGARVVAGSRTAESLEGLDGVTAVALDLATPNGPAELVQRALDEHGRIDVLVNNVGAVRLRLEGFLGTSDDEFEWAMQMNFFIALRATRAALVPMVEQGGGAIVNVASVNAFFQPDAGTIDYGAAKAALVNLSKSLAQEFGPQGVHVNCVSPGPVGTDLWLGEHGVAETVAAATGVDADTARETVIAGIGGFATGRFTTPEEVATLVTLLASQRTANVTGANYVHRRRTHKDDLDAGRRAHHEHVRLVPWPTAKSHRRASWRRMSPACGGAPEVRRV